MSTYVASTQVASPDGASARGRGGRLLPSAVLMSVLLAGCGSTVAGLGASGSVAEPPDDAVAASTPTAQATGAPAAEGPAVADPVLSDPDAVLTGQGLILQKDGQPPMACLGGVDESYPPQCSGPELVGLDWADVPQTETASGVTWGDARVVGTYDGQTFTLTEPPSEMRIPVEPESGTGADPHPQLCDDPFRGGDEQAVADPDVADPMEGKLTRMVGSYEGYVGSWVSTDLTGEQLDADTPHAYTYHVLVTGDPEQAHADFREVWPGGLCVEQRDVPTQQQVRQAQEALNLAGIRDIYSSGGSGEGRLQVAVLLADQQTVVAIHRAVEPWLTPGQVDIGSSLVPAQPQG